MAQYAGKYAGVLTSGAAVNITDEATTDVAGAHTTYQVTAAAHRILSPAGTVTVKVNGSAADPAAYTLDRLFGKVTFLAPLGAGDTVTIDGAYLPVTRVAGAQSAELMHQKSNLDATTFDSQGWTERDHGIGDTSGTIDRFFQVDGLFTAAVQDGAVIVVEFQRDSVNTDWRAWAVFSQSDVKGAAAELVGESLQWSGTTDADGRSVSYG